MHRRGDGFSVPDTGLRRQCPDTHEIFLRERSHCGHRDSRLRSDRPSTAILRKRRSGEGHELLKTLNGKDFIFSLDFYPCDVLTFGRNSRVFSADPVG